jgi:hypothetical protein
MDVTVDRPSRQLTVHVVPTLRMRGFVQFWKQVGFPS